MPTAAERVIQIIFRGEDEVSGVLKTIGGNIDGFAARAGRINDAVGDVTAPFASLAGGVLKADAALGALAAGGLAYAFKKSKDFEDASIELVKVLGDEADQLGVAQAQARALSGEYGEASTDVLASTANFKQAGFDIQDSMTLAKNALDLVIAGDLEAAEASEVLISSLKGFREPAGEAGRLIDILNEVSNNYATDIRQLATGMAEVSPIARTMGFSMEETAGLVTPVIEIFRSGSEAARALKTGLLRLVDDNPTVVRALESIGVSQQDANGQLRSGKDILADVAQAFTTLDQNQKLFVATNLVGVEQAARMVEVFDNLGKTSEITAVAMNSAGSAAKEVGERLAGSTVSVNRFVEGVANLAIATGEQFRAAAKEAIDGGTEIVNALDAAVSGGALDPLFASLETRLQALGAFLSDVAEALPDALGRADFSGFLDSLDDLGDEVRSLFGGVDLTTPEGLAEVIQQVVDGVETLTMVTSGIVSGAGPFIDWALEVAESFIAMEDGAKKATGEALGAGAALNQVSSLAGGVIGAIGGIGDGLKALAGAHLARTIAGLVGEGGLSSALSTTAASAGSLISRLAGPAGVAAVVAGSTVAVGLAVREYLAWQEAEDEAAAAADRAAASAQNLAERYAQISEQTGVNIDSTERFHQAIKAGEIVFDEATRTWLNAADAAATLSDSTTEAADELVDWGEALRGARDASGALVVVAGESADAMAANRDAAIAARAAWFEMQGVAPELARQMAELEKPVTATAEGVKAAAEETDAFRLKLLEIASDERLKRLEFAVDIRTAQIEADTARITAAFNSVDKAIESTGQTLSSLTGSLAGISSSDLNSISKTNFIERQIEAEGRRRDEALETQKRLTEAQAENLEIRNRLLREGGGLVQIDSTGLEPALETVMWHILEKVQVRVNEEASELLLGIGGG